ncbi:hypothetical protein GQ457_17G005000 [Hibiscus cannabinus]
MVGSPNGSWDTNTDLQTWYTSNHDVLEVTQANYDSCSTSSPNDTHIGGNTLRLELRQRHPLDHQLLGLHHRRICLRLNHPEMTRKLSTIASNIIGWDQYEDILQWTLASR